jgi:hypothetical protein
MAKTPLADNNKMPILGQQIALVIPKQPVEDCRQMRRCGVRNGLAAREELEDRLPCAAG